MMAALLSFGHTENKPHLLCRLEIHLPANWKESLTCLDALGPTKAGDVGTT